MQVSSERIVSSTNFVSLLEMISIYISLCYKCTMTFLCCNLYETTCIQLCGVLLLSTGLAGFHIKAIRLKNCILNVKEIGGK